MVVYQDLYGERGFWARPLEMFLEKVQVDGKWVDRFSREVNPFKNEGWILLKGLIPQDILQEVRELFASVTDFIIDKALSEGIIENRREGFPLENRLAQLPHDFMKKYGRSWRDLVARAPVDRLQTYHRSLPNTTNSIRWSIDLRYYRLGKPPIHNRMTDEKPWVIRSQHKPMTTLTQWEEMVKELGW